MDDAALVRRPDRARGLPQKHDRAIDRQRPGLEASLEIIAAQPLHQEVRAVAVIPDVVNLDDARVMDARRRPRLVEESRDDVTQRRHLLFRTAPHVNDELCSTPWQ